MGPHPASAPSVAQPATCDVAPATAAPRSPAVSWIAAGLAAGCVLAAGASLEPRVVATALFFALGVESDVRRLRLPNWLTGGALALALAAHGFTGGLAGFGHALAAAAVALVLLLPSWRLGFLGAGDVKAAAALGAVWGSAAWLLTALVWSALIGGVLGLALLAVGGELGALLSRWQRSFVASLLARRWVWMPPAPGSLAARVIPFGAVLALGASATLAWGAPWA